MEHPIADRRALLALHCLALAGRFACATLGTFLGTRTPAECTDRLTHPEYSRT
jgi:hypothetical protein